MAATTSTCHFGCKPNIGDGTLRALRSIAPRLFAQRPSTDAFSANETI
jgi:hypothetical protein